jgi:putative transposase
LSSGKRRSSLGETAHSGVILTTRNQSVSTRANNLTKPVVTDKLRSYTKPIDNLAPGADHRAHKGLNNRIEGSHLPTRKREKIMGRFKSPGQAQRFLAAHDQINTLFRPRRYRLSALSWRDARSDAFDLWGAYTLEMSA